MLKKLHQKNMKQSLIKARSPNKMNKQKPVLMIKRTLQLISLLKTTQLQTIKMLAQLSNLRTKTKHRKK